MRSCLVAINRNVVEVVIALIGKNQIIWMRIKMKAVSIRPHQRLDDWSQRQEWALIEYCLSNLECVWCFKVFESFWAAINLSLSTLLFLLFLQLLEVVPLDLFEVVVSTNHDLFPSEAHSHRVRRQHYLLYPSRPISFHASHQKLREREVGQQFAHTWVVGAGHEHPLGQVSEADQPIFPDNSSNSFKILTEFVERLGFVIFLGDVVSDQEDDFRPHLFKPGEHLAEGLVLLSIVKVGLVDNNHALLQVVAWVCQLEFVKWSLNFSGPCLGTFFFELQIHGFSHFDVGAKVILLVELEFELFVGVERRVHHPQ